MVQLPELHTGTYTAQLHINGNQYQILACGYAFSREMDSKGRPSSGIHGGTMEMVMHPAEDTMLLESMVNTPYKALKGQVLFFTLEGNPFRQIDFEDAYMVTYQEQLSVDDTAPMMTTFTLSARKLVVGQAHHENDWPDRK